MQYINASNNPSYKFELILIGQAVVAMSLTLFFDSRTYKFKVAPEPSNIMPIDDKVQFDISEINAEATRVADLNNSDPIRILNLKKTYPDGFQAIRDISVSVEKGQIFGLLGPNGAGKSTAFNILTALVPRTSGSIKFNETEIDTNISDIFKEVGVCPQFDCLWEDLTVKDHLRVFGRMKGLNGKELEENIDYYIKVMSLTDEINKKSNVLSGGNKRKLSVANALIGSPYLQFFDEPSKGLDSVAKRFLWTALKQNIKNRNSSMILTTHSMSEAESLCHKIGKSYYFVYR